MYYVCVEDNLVISILSYKPETPPSVSVIEITDTEYNEINDNIKYFDVSAKKVLPLRNSFQENLEKQQKNAIEREFLNSTDWKILRHLRQQYLNLPTSLTEEQFTDLEKKRHASASRIIE
jgi:FKBP-type peptidyl-prolyl cis-trans isomerase (trigger factor)